MTAFLVISAVLAAVAIALLAWPLLRPVVRETGRARHAGIAATLVAVLLPVAAFGMYFLASNWSWNAPAPEEPAAATDLRQIVARLQVRLTQQPSDVQGWKLLGRSAVVLGDYALAREAFGEAYTRTQAKDAEAIVGYAEALVLTDEREIDGQGALLFERALELAPENSRALWYGGIVAYRRGDLALAERRWVELQNQSELPADLRQFLAQQLAGLAEARSGGPSASAPAAQGAIAIAVDIESELVAKVNPDSRLFVIARRGAGGPPLAVVRRAVGDWPVNLTMSDADAMLPGTTLASGGAVNLIARISQNGTPTASSGDLFGEVSYDFSSAHPARITIDRIVP